MSFPKELNLASNRPMAAAGKPSINRYRADNSSYQGGDVIRIEIPCGRSGQYLFPMDCFIEGRIKCNATPVLGTGGTPTQPILFIDQNIYSIFNRMRVIHGSNVIEDCLYVNRLWNVIYDLQINEVERRGDTITKLVNDNTTSAAGIPTAGQGYNNGLSGAIFKISTTLLIAAGAADTQLYDFSFVLPSAVLGALCSKAIPLGLMGASSLYLELELAPANVAFVCFNGGGTTTSGSYTVNSYTVQDIYYNAKITTLPDDVNNLILESTGGIINIPAVSYKAEMKSIPSTASSYNDKFSFQYSSLKTFLFWFTASTTAIGNMSLRTITSRPKCFLTDYFLLINGEAYPSQSIGYGSTAVANTSGNSARMYSELLRSFNYLTDVNSGGILSYFNYSVDDATANETLGAAITGDPGTITVQKRFVAGIDLDRFNRSSDVLMCGTSSIGQMVNLNLGFSQACGSGSGTSVGVNLYAAVMYDVLYHIENGQMLAKF